MELKSSCCKALLVVAKGDEGTSHYECSKCGKPCDQASDEKQPATGGCFVYNQMTFIKKNSGFTISPSLSGPNNIRIEADGGEGGDFDAGLFFDVIEKFYREHF